MAFNATWTPGRQAVAGVHLTGPVPALVLYLDPDSLAFTPPPNQAAWADFARFLRELQAEADKLASFVEFAVKQAGVLPGDESLPDGGDGQ